MNDSLPCGCSEAGPCGDHGPQKPWLDLDGRALRKEIEVQFERSFTGDTVEAIAQIIERDRKLAFQRGQQSMAEKAAQEVEQCNREGPYNAICAAPRIRALVGAEQQRPTGLAGIIAGLKEAEEMEAAAPQDKLRELVAKWRTPEGPEPGHVINKVYAACAAELEQLLSRDSGGTKP